MKPILTQIHAVCGCIVALIGLVQLMLPKHGKRHRLMGWVYSFAWIGIVVTGVFIGHWLISMIGVFGLYMVYTGHRFAHDKAIQIQWYDKLVIAIATLSSLGLIVGGIYLLAVKGTSFGIIAIAFGGLFSSTTVKDCLVFILQKSKHKFAGHRLVWKFEHFNRMSVSYIAAMTAFSALQNIFGLELANWLVPVGLGIVLMTFANKYYIKQWRLKPKTE